jgi:hypothetical protein
MRGAPAFLGASGSAAAFTPAQLSMDDAVVQLRPQKWLHHLRKNRHQSTPSLLTAAPSPVETVPEELEEPAVSFAEPVSKDDDPASAAAPVNGKAAVLLDVPRPEEAGALKLTEPAAPVQVLTWSAAFWRLFLIGV